MGYIVIELQTMPDGAIGNFVFAFIGKTEKENEQDAFSKYFAILSAAAVSSLPCHAAVILTSTGRQIASQFFEH